jgi:hypothetical protein
MKSNVLVVMVCVLAAGSCDSKVDSETQAASASSGGDAPSSTGDDGSSGDVEGPPDASGGRETDPDATTTGDSTTGVTTTGNDETTDGLTTGVDGMVSIAGSVTRTAMPTSGGVGNVYVAIFDADPIVSSDATPLGQAILESVDMSGEGAVSTYQIDGLVPTDAELFAVAFLDDNGNADQTSPGPDMGDLVTLDGTGVPRFSLEPSGVTPLNLVLNAVMPF